MNAVNDYLSRKLFNFTEEEQEWFRYRQFNVSASDVALLSRENSVKGVVDRKLNNQFFGNRFTEHGSQREPVIASWVQENENILPNSFLFYADNEERHLATPDGVAVVDGELVLAEIKTTNKPFKRVPLKYLRQIWWQQYVLGADRTLFVWEEHDNFVPKFSEPQTLWVYRDEDAVKKLKLLADLVLIELDSVVKR